MNYSPIEEVALTQKLVRIESTNPGAFEYKVSDFVYDFLAQTGADVLRHEVKDGRCNIVATLKGEQSGPRLVYICHQDTVPLGDGWHHEAFESFLDARGRLDGLLRGEAVMAYVQRTVCMNTADAIDPDIQPVEVGLAANMWVMYQLQKGCE